MQTTCHNIHLKEISPVFLVLWDSNRFKGSFFLTIYINNFVDIDKCYRYWKDGNEFECENREQIYPIFWYRLCISRDWQQGKEGTNLIDRVEIYSNDRSCWVLSWLKVSPKTAWFWIWPNPADNVFHLFGKVVVIKHKEVQYLKLNSYHIYVGHSWPWFAVQPVSSITQEVSLEKYRIYLLKTSYTAKKG